MRLHVHRPPIHLGEREGERVGETQKDIQKTDEEGQADERVWTNRIGYILALYSYLDLNWKFYVRWRFDIAPL